MNSPGNAPISKLAFRIPAGVPLARWQRILLIVVSLGLLAGFGLAGFLTPDPRGFGTHQQLGLPPCGFAAVFGMPCPSCGATTSFSFFVRGNWIQALQANAAAFTLAVICGLAVPWCCVSSYLGKAWGISSPSRVVLIGLVILTSIAAMQWGVRAFLSS